MLPLRLRIIQLVGELAIPLAGYFWWHWDFYFIGLFYVLDLLVSLVFTGIKWRYIQREQHNVNAYVLLWGLLLLSLFLGGFLLLLLLRVMQVTDFDPFKESYRFLAYEDMGIAQGYVLFPLLAYNGWMQFRMFFVRPELHRSLKPVQVFKSSLLDQLILPLALCLLILLYQTWHWPEMFGVIALAVMLGVYRFFRP